MIARPPGVNAYEFVVVASLRAHQLMEGSVPRIEGVHKAITMAQMEVAEGYVSRVVRPEESATLIPSV
jgi:DNA-directed RNA polymerase subunit K/omega